MRLQYLLLVALITAMSFPGVGAEPPPAATEFPVPVVEAAGDFNGVLARTAQVYIGGQPDASALTRMRALGVDTIVNLRTAAEMTNRQQVPFDEKAKPESLGMRYAHTPAGGPKSPYSPSAVDQLAAAIAGTEGKVLLHCASGRRASHLWVAYLVRHEGLTLEEAMSHGRAVNFGELPLEGFLGEPISFELAR
jgi:uncharacterized protein (TIGR01244 family)